MANNILYVLSEFMGNLRGVARSFVYQFPVGLIDMAITAYVLYHAIRLVRETRAMQLLKGIAAILVVYFVAAWLNMIVISFFIKNILQVGIMLVVVLFQPELRSALDKMGRTQLSRLHLGGEGMTETESRATESLIAILVDSCVELSRQKTGALMVIERNTRLGEVINTGTLIDGAPSRELISNIFFLNSPLHDGAMVIRGCRIYAAGCYLPLSQNMGISRELGTRHRAALGMSEVSDAVVLVVSEETGAITMAADSKLQRGLSAKNLQKLLQLKLLGSGGKEEPRSRGSFWRFWRRKQ